MMMTSWQLPHLISIVELLYLDHLNRGANHEMFSTTGTQVIAMCRALYLDYRLVRTVKISYLERLNSHVEGSAKATANITVGSLAFGCASEVCCISRLG